MPTTHPSRFVLRFAHRGVVVLLCLSLGLHWALLQGIAWTGMLISFAQEGTVIEAVEKTFDGQHGCALCAKVKKGSGPDQGQPKQTGQRLTKIDAVLVELPRLVPPAPAPMTFAARRDVLLQRNELPETPPPRRAQA